jgi:formylglycine-generating enzyme required for sulfatase activity
MGAGAWGQLDLVGELFEWNLDVDGTQLDPCSDCANLTPGVARMARGGAYHSIAASLLATGGSHAGPTDRSDDLGFRCARKP